MRIYTRTWKTHAMVEWHHYNNFAWIAVGKSHVLNCFHNFHSTSCAREDYIKTNNKQEYFIGLDCFDSINTRLTYLSPYRHI